MVKVTTEVKPEDLKYHFVFLEKMNKDGRVEYGSGEYLVMEASPSVLYVAKPAVGYEFASGYSGDPKALVGNDPWTVVKSHYDKERLLELARENYLWGKYEKGQWIQYVYESAKNKAGAILKDLNEPFPTKQEAEENVLEKTIVAGRAEVLLSRKMKKLINNLPSNNREDIRNIVERLFFELGQ